jgi:putative methyltransferase (TIGR04325 family)
MTLRSLLTEWCPPILAKRMRTVARRARSPANETRFDGQYATWQEAAARSRGYDSDVIFQKTRDAILKVRSGEAAFERDSVTFDRPEYPLFLIASLLHVAAARGGRLSILDFGGALGSSYYQCRTFTSTVRDLRWSVVEQPHYVKYGQTDLQTDVLRFHATIDDCVRIEKPNVALLSGVLHCIEKPYEIIDQIVGHRIDYVIVDRQPLMPTAAAADERVCVAAIASLIYEASYPLWLLSDGRFRAAWARGYDLVAEGSDGAPLMTHVGQLPRRQLLYSRRA